MRGGTGMDDWIDIMIWLGCLAVMVVAFLSLL